MPFSDRFSYLLRNSHISQAAFGTLVGASQQTVSRWVNGHVEPDIDQLIRCARIFGVSVDYLVGASDEPVAIIDTKKDPSPEERERAVRAGAAALDGQPAPEFTESERRWLKLYVDTAIDRALEKRGMASSGPTGSQDHTDP